MKEPPWDELDPLIVPLVRLLLGAGIETLSSCQGGEGHLERLPWVLCAFPLTSTSKLIATTLLDAGWTGFTVEESVCRLYQKAKEPKEVFHRINVVVWTLEGQPV